jgi:hypothetical protein
MKYNKVHIRRKNMEQLKSALSGDAVWSQKTKTFVLDLTAWAGVGVALILGFIGVPGWGIAISEAVVACAITVEGLIPAQNQ